ncbi:flagellar biosynthetic protein FliR [Methylotuvimicrobium buryatense]|uniref:Flagellar biosynthetic protein FliR n=1 Tax=Methylotuvimicrobium buryatense TaxID=95641 RepID=A0A4P9USP6_METBY|nr:flagellar biosynthetic protein FliR [Methylotuvimicrobium buryatense]QCW83563.1 flagellar biosynthetic protein FliR [Methylotuvimicrobium buryatense]
MNVTEAQLLNWVASFIWPLMRIGAMLIAAPLFSMQGVPPRVRLVISVGLTWIVMPLLPPLPDVPMLSYQGLAVSMQQILIGLVSGFIIQMVFGIVVFAGQTIAYSMGLGFASMVDPQSGQQIPVLAQFYIIVSTLIFFVLDGHLMLIRMVLDSFNTVPIAVDGLGQAEIWSIIAWSSRLFASGLLLALPVMASLLMVNVSFGVAARAAPQLHIFAVGFPVTLMLGLLLIWLTLPTMLQQFTGVMAEGYELLEQVLRL